MRDHGSPIPITEHTQNGRSVDLKVPPGHRREVNGDAGLEVTNGVSGKGTTPAPRSAEEIAGHLRAFIGHRTYRQIGEETGYNPESVRRYLQGKTRLPADFVAAVCCAYDIDPLAVLINDAKDQYRKHPSPTPEDRLTESLVDWLRPRMKRWVQTNVVPFGLFLRQIPVEMEEVDNDAEIPKPQD